MTESAVELQNIFGTYHLHNLIKDPKCFKNPDKPLCITSKKLSQVIIKITNFKAGLSDFYKLVVNVPKIYYKKQKPLVVTYRHYKNF